MRKVKKKLTYRNWWNMETIKYLFLDVIKFHYLKKITGIGRYVKGIMEILF